MSAAALLEIPIGSMPLRTVVIRHNLPDGTHHFDWMLARDSKAENSLVTFRMELQVDKLTAPGNAQALRIANHRPIYLEYEGPISQDRGIVQRLRSGSIITVDEDASSNQCLGMSIRWDEPASDEESCRDQQLLILHEKDDVWQVFCGTMIKSSGTR